MLGPGSRVAHYVIEGHLGRGGMGEVYAAFDERLERRVALKFLPAERVLDVVARGRMLREARAASALKHPGIVTIYEIGDAGGRTFIAMELVEGETLAQLSGRRGPLPPAEAVGLVRQIGDALAVAHEAGILHRDVKTANLMVDGRGQVKVLDFGLSKRVPGTGAPSSPPASSSGPFPLSTGELPTQADGDDDADGIDPAGPTVLPASRPSPAPPARATPASDPMTIHGARMGTPGSAAPELMRGEEADRRSDVFSLGIVLYELLCGRRPFRAETMSTLIDQVVSERYEPASQVNPAVSPRLDAAIARALKPQREDRFATIGELVETASAAVDGAGAGGGARRGAGAGGARGEAGARTSRRRVALAAAVLLGAGGATAWIVRSGGTSGAGAGATAGQPAATPDAAPTHVGLPPAPTPRVLTRLGGCAYAPAFADDRTVAFDLTIGEENHVWSVPLAGGAAQQLTRGSFTEWRAMPGRKPGEIVYLVSNPASNTGEGAGVAVMDLTGERTQMLLTQQVASAAFVGDELYYLRRDGAELRRVRQGVDEVVLTFPGGMTVKVLGVSHDRTRVALLAGAPGTPRVCRLDLPDKQLECLNARRMGPGRPAFSLDDTWIYYAGFQGIGRIRTDGSADELVLPDVFALGGLAVSPDGKQLVYSDCYARGPLLDTGETPPRELTAPGRIGDPGAGPDGRLVYALAAPDGHALMLRQPDGATRQIAGPFDRRIGQPRFSRDGRRIVYVLAGAGLHTVQLDGSQVLTPMPLTTDASDGDPAWLADGRVAFTRSGGDAAGAYVVDVDGGAPRRLGRVPRRTVGALANGHVLLLGVDSVSFFEWDPVHKRERKSAVSMGEYGRVVGVAMAPGGRWLAVQAGTFAQRVYRFDLSQPEPKPELAFEAKKGQTMGTIAITDTGHVLAAPMTWSGELNVLDAAPGQQF